MFLVRVAQLILISVPIALFVWLMNQELVPSGTFVVHHTIGEDSPFIDRLLPDARVTDEGVITDDPVFFFVHPHRHFDRVDAEVWFKNDSVPIVELGALGNVEAQAYDLHPLQNLIIDRLDWGRIEQDGLVLLQRNATYVSINDFLMNPPPVSKIATYQAKLDQPFVLEGYAPSQTIRVTDVSLRGFHEFKTYVKNETLSFDFAYMDMNRDEGADAVTVVVTNVDGEPVGDARASDDGNVSADSQPSGMQHLSVAVPGLPEGAYKVELRVGRDIFWRTIATTQQKMTFLNNVFLADEVGYKPAARTVRFWTEGKHLSFATRHAEGLQTVWVGSQMMKIDEPYKRFALDVAEDGIVGAAAERGDLEVTTDGHVAFSPEQYFNPDPVRLMYNTDLDRLGVDYVIAAYTAPRREGEWYVANVSFDTAKMVLDEGAWKFVFSTPGIKELGASMTVGRIDMTWMREPFEWKDLYEYLGGKN